MWLEWAVAGLFGALIGAGEIVSQFRDEPDDALRTFPALGYMLFNALASLFALAVIRIFGWTMGVQDPAMTGWAQVVVAGFGAMALLGPRFSTCVTAKMLSVLGQAVSSKLCWPRSRMPSTVNAPNSVGWRSAKS